MNSKNISDGIIRALLTVVSAVLLLYFLYKIESVIVYVAIAGVISLIVRPLIRFLNNRLKFPNILSVIIVISFMIGFFIGLIDLFIPLVTKQGENLSLLNTAQLEENIQSIFSEINQYLLSKNIDVLNQIKGIDIFSQFKTIPEILNSFLGTLGSLGIGLFSVLFICFFFIKDSFILKNAVMTVIPDSTEERFSRSLEKIKNLLSYYFIGLLFQITILFVLYTIILLVFGISNPIVIAFLCALLNLIPYVGPLAGGLIMFLLSMTSNIGQDFRTQILPTAIYVMIGYLIAQLIDNFVSQPLIFSKATKSHPLEIFLVILIGGTLFGIIGMITAVPIYTALKVILKEFLSENKIVKSLTKDI